MFARTSPAAARRDADGVPAASTGSSPVKLAFADHRQDPDAWGASLGISREAIAIYAAAEVFDLHIDTFIWKRIFGYDLGKRHGRGPFGARFFHQVDLPRLREARVGGGMWSITTNPLRSARGRAKTFVKNVANLHAELRRYPDDVAVVRNLRELRAARAKDLHAAMIVVQGGNALSVGLRTGPQSDAQGVASLDFRDFSVLRNLVNQLALVHVLSPRYFLSKIRTTSIAFYTPRLLRSQASVL